jgi:hypothetical protein
MGGMAAQIPIKGDRAANDAAIAKVGGGLCFWRGFACLPFVFLGGVPF